MAKGYDPYNKRSNKPLKPVRPIPIDKVGPGTQAWAFDNDHPMDADRKWLEKKTKNKGSTPRPRNSINADRLDNIKPSMAKEGIKRPISLSTHNRKKIVDTSRHPWKTSYKGKSFGIADGNHRMQVAKELNMKRVPVSFTPNLREQGLIDNKRKPTKPKGNTGMARGYNPYNKPAKKPKTPAYKKASPTNPRNNAGVKVKATSTGPKSWNDTFNPKYDKKPSNSTRAYTREMGRASAQNGKSLGAMSDKEFSKVSGRASDALEGMNRKNSQKSAGTALKRMTSPTNPKVSQGVNAYTKYGARRAAMGAVAKRAAGIGLRAVGGAVGTAFGVGYTVGSLIYAAGATHIQDAIGPRQKNYSDTYKIPKKIKRK